MERLRTVVHKSNVQDHHPEREAEGRAGGEGVGHAELTLDLSVVAFGGSSLSLALTARTWLAYSRLRRPGKLR